MIRSLTLPNGITIRVSVPRSMVVAASADCAHNPARLVERVAFLDAALPVIAKGRRWNQQVFIFAHVRLFAAEEALRQAQVAAAAPAAAALTTEGVAA